MNDVPEVTLPRVARSLDQIEKIAATLARIERAVLPPSQPSGRASVSLQWLDDAHRVGLLRFHPNGGSHVTHAPYTWVACIVQHKCLKWEIVGACGDQYTLGMRRLIRRLLNDHNIFAIHMARYNNTPRKLELK